MDKKAVVHIHNGVLLSHKKEWTMPFVATWMDLEMIICSEVQADYFLAEPQAKPKNTGVDTLSLLKGIFTKSRTQLSN